MTYKNLLICLILSTTLLNCKETVAQDQTNLISPTEMLKSIDSSSVLIIDVRTPEEFKEGHIKNAKNIDFLSPSFTKEISGLDKEKPVYIYCRSGNRSGKSVKDFLNAGFTEVYDLEVGIVGWKSQGLPVVFD